MSTTPALHAHSLGDLASVLPALFGFTPSESLVVVAIKDGQLAAGGRIDVVDVVVAASELLVNLGRHADYLIAFAVTDSSDSAQAALDAVGGDVRAFGWVHDDVCADLFDGGTESDCSRFTQTATEAVVAGLSSVGSREELSRTVSYDPSWASLVTWVETDYDPETTVAYLSGGHDFGPEVISRLRQSLSRGDVRDEVWRSLSRETAPSFLVSLSAILRSVNGAAVRPFAAITATAAYLTGNGTLTNCILERADVSRLNDPIIAAIEMAIANALPPETFESIIRQAF